MKRLYIIGTGGPDKLQLKEEPDPQPGGSELRIRVKASGVNFADILARKGLYPDAPKLPAVVGYEVSGVVDAAGPQADASWVGKPVFALTRFGGYADTVVVPQDRVFEKPATACTKTALGMPACTLTPEFAGV